MFLEVQHFSEDEETENVKMTSCCTSQGVKEKTQKPMGDILRVKTEILWTDILGGFMQKISSVYPKF